MKNLVFVCGNQRSGTTWLANIFDADPDTFSLMEPFAPQSHFFLHLPHEHVYIQPPSTSLEVELREGIAKLSQYKSPIWRGHAPGAFALRAEYQIMKALFKMNRLLRTSWLDFAKHYLLLNLNKTDHKQPYPKKNREPKVWMIKELRLSNKIALMQSTFPSAKFIHIVRHPVATVYSMLSWFERGHLQELKSNMDIYLEYLQVQHVFQPYSDLIEHCKHKGIASKLSLYWLISNELIQSQFGNTDNATLVVYERLAQSPMQEVKRLFDFVGLETSAQVINYVQNSSTKTSSTPGIVSTFRQSDLYYKDWQAKVSDALTTEILEIASRSSLLEEINRHY